MNDMFESMERDFFGPWGTLAPRFPPAMADMPRALTKGNYAMDLDLHETKDGYELTADLPGMSKEDITVDVDSESRVLTVSGERQRSHEETSDGSEGRGRCLPCLDLVGGREPCSGIPALFGRQ